ncbi:hypothetical protein DFH08DRAFT_827916 [Mycena albidolilacea]|uniref:Uncharacterized protein n=1 Tax=Mycena albidolilacea TaxID=1033008 RepID=A0AAD6YX94_9AGAR|nr:hypothetical protein DFH08DRAFT_827916 [Mycena albidolilacea]
MGKQEAPDPESIDELKAHLANMKKAQAERCPQGRPSKPKNKSKAPKAGTEDDTAINTPTNANAKKVMPSTKPKPAREPKPVKGKSQVKPRGVLSVGKYALP